jgi:hypothetical protein
MGNSNSSEVRQSVDNKIITKNMLDAFNQQITNVATESIMQSVQKSAASDAQSSNIKIKGIRAAGPNSKITGLTVNVNQSSVVTLDVLSKTIQNNDIDTKIATAIINSVSQNLSNEQLTKLVSEADSTQKVAGLALTGGNKNDSKVITDMKSETVTDIQRKFISIVNNTINNKSETLNYKDCITTSYKSAIVDVGQLEAIDGGTIENIIFDITQTSQVINKCIFETIQSSKLTTDLASTVGLQVTDTISNKQVTESEAKAKASQTIESIFNLYSIIALVVILLIISSGAMIYMQMKSGGGGGD